MFDNTTGIFLQYVQLCGKQDIWSYILYVTIVWSVSLKVIEDEDGRRWPAAPLAAREWVRRGPARLQATTHRGYSGEQEPEKLNKKISLINKQQNVRLYCIYVLPIVIERN